ncbi:MAG: methylated-DNA--[protein]-cysteine S-methyltransferase [SAR202 cluster bacterium]|nr:methylated-DNA--[protein]-cysteine S-methyltransferase [SAR202 cluster bacterium]|tara:strand:+ start:1600 stop:2100 length:501 start_codon:yes stop_codon:yes gene_type:complete
MFYYTFNSKIGWITAISSDLGILRISLPEKSSEISASQFKNEINLYESNPDKFKEIIEKIESYFDGYLTDFTDITIDFSQMSNFQKMTLKQCRKIKSGETKSYKWLAEKINHPKAWRAIGNALSQNPVPIIIPCHRVINSNGKLGGYLGEMKNNFKKKLLEIEFNN